MGDPAVHHGEIHLRGADLLGRDRVQVFVDDHDILSIFLDVSLFTVPLTWNTAQLSRKISHSAATKIQKSAPACHGAHGSVCMYRTQNMV